MEKKETKGKAKRKLKTKILMLPKSGEKWIEMYAVFSPDYEGWEEESVSLFGSILAAREHVKTLGPGAYVKGEVFVSVPLKEIEDAPILFRNV